MKLTIENFQDWKEELNRIAKPHFGLNFTDTIEDEGWLSDRIGDTPQEVLNDELYYSAQD